MSTPLATIFAGDVTLESGSDVTQFGWGDLSINRRLIINGTENSTGAMSVGTLLLSGGARVARNMSVHENTYVLYGSTYLTETHIDTTNGPTTVTGGNRVDISVGASSQFVSTGGNLSLVSQTQSLQLYGGLNSLTAVDIQALNSVGGVRVLSGAGGRVDVISGSGGINETTSNGSIALTANNGSGSFTVNTQTADQNLVLGTIGLTDSKVRIESSGTNVTRSAIEMVTTNTAGNIVIANGDTTGTGSGSISQLTGSGGYYVRTNTSGTVNVISQAANSNYTVQSAAGGQNMTVELAGLTDSSLVLQSQGLGSTRPAILIQTLSTTGNIQIYQPDFSLGGVNIRTGTGGLTTSTRTGGSTTMTTYGATSLYTNATMADGQNLTVSVSGNTKSKVIVSSSGVGSDAIRLETTSGTGGIYMTSVGGVGIESTNVDLGVKIATETSGIPVRIGTTNSTTTIVGNLDVKGVTSTIESTVVTIDDNIIVVNNAPGGTSDGGLAIKRYQWANDVAGGDVVLDTPEETGTAQATGNTTTTIKLATGANVTDDYYAGYWVRITGGTGTGQVRRIRSYVGATRTATIYSTADQTGVLANVTPIEGLDFLTIPDSTSEYGLYPCHYVMAIWDESADEFALICSNTNPSDGSPNIAHYSNLHLNNLQANAIYANTINDSAADITTTVILDDSNMTPVSITGFPVNYGIYLVFVKPLAVTTRAHAIFMIGRVNSPSISGTIVRLISVKGTQLEHLDMQWRANQYPEIYYRPNPLGGTGTTTYKVKIVSL